MHFINCIKLSSRYYIYKIPKQFGVSCIQRRTLFHESDPRGEYKQEDKHSFFFHVKNGWKLLGREFKLWQTEVKEKFDGDIDYSILPGIPKKVWNVKSPADLDNWVVASDSDNNEGGSSAEWVISPSGHGLFTGTLDNIVPKDGAIKRAGYCSIRTVRPMRSFMRDSYIDWSGYTHLVLRVRGDGRTYMLNIACSGYYDQLWNDVYHYMLHTRGGPYWQLTKIPFSKFFKSSKGRIQDRQEPMLQSQITNLGITAADKIDGTFSLEIDYVGIEYNPMHTEEFAYEMYETPRFLAGS